MHRSQKLDRFQFDNYLILNQQIQSITLVEFYAFVHERHWHLAPNVQTTLYLLKHECALICRLQQPRAKMTMQIQSSTNYFV